MDDLLQNLIFVIVALGAWAVKAVLERREAAGRKPTRSRPGPAGPPVATRPKEAKTGEVDVVYGRTPVPAPMAPRPRRQEPRMPEVETPTLGETLPGLRPSVTSASMDSFEARRLEARAHHALADLEVGGAMRRSGRASGHRRRAVLRRLGASEAGSRRDIVRAGVLWSELLGAPRAVSGPHRSPAARRLSRG